MSKIIILSGSPRRQSSSLKLVHALATGAAAVGSEVEIVETARMTIQYCRGCDYCRSHNGVCVIQDDMAAILAKIEAADVVVLASPLYFRAFSAQLKTCIDRFYCRHHAKTLKGKGCALIVTSGNNNPEVMESFYQIYRDLIELLGWHDRGIIWAGGCRSGDFDSIDPLMASLEAAKDLGRSLG